MGQGSRNWKFLYSKIFLMIASGEDGNHLNTCLEMMLPAELFTKSFVDVMHG